MVPVYINNFNRFDYLLAILQEFERFHKVMPIRVTVVDNASTLPSLLEWYDDPIGMWTYSLSFNRGTNDGPRGYYRAMKHKDPYYIVCDPDIDFSTAPDDLFELLIRGLVDNKEILKTGPSLRISDVPSEHPFYRQIMDVEGKFFTNSLDDRWWHAQLDTTCIACRTGQGFGYGPALRAKAPYDVRHLPYYYIPGKLTEEEVYYLDNLPDKHKHGIYWSTLMSTGTYSTVPGLLEPESTKT